MSFVSTAKTPSTIPQAKTEMPSRKRKCDELTDQDHPIKKPLFNKEDYDAADPLPVDLTLAKINNSDLEKRKSFWYYVLCLLMDTQNRDVIAWTGKGREFFIHDRNELAAGWCRYQGNQKFKWQSVLRLFRLQTERGIIARLGPRGGHYARLLFAFITEPSVHVGYTREQLDAFIADNKVAQPTGYLSSLSKKNPCPSTRCTPSSTTSSSDDDNVRASESPDSISPTSFMSSVTSESPAKQSTPFMIPTLFPFYPITVTDLYSPFVQLPNTSVEKTTPVAQHKFSIDSILGL
ncbi:hypothetical protein PRIPAC_73833 [Pristionchus pacificus]|uniref:ETS domain-containing protein n=1 Tax=Pristionchus pacificus TaxID=54126 RepID=A0A454Y4Z7_PRIPA|nr:hypothetical protein PRIPAC_73833 [Pristionchus pacificus]|eukprot:PDM73780.1 hypothetical protein PRIPAC_41136 [Pristionchus pacificus]